MSRLSIACLLAALALAAPASAATPHAGAQYRYWAFRDHQDLRDVLAYWVPGPFHVQLEYWDFVSPRSHDQFRPEIGLHLRDGRRSVYTLQWRHERVQERFWLGTDQVLNRHLVGRAEISPIVARHSTVWVWDVGGDWYWGSYSFFSATAIHDPRDRGLWVVPLRVRLATPRNDWLQLTLAPASRRTIGWAVDARRAWLRAGIERNDRFDFTTRDNTIFTAGFEVPIGRAE